VTRPTITAELLAELTAAAPARLVRKLDADPRQAEAWTWAAGEALEITTPRGERVQLRGACLRSREDLSCSCLLAPRCLHLLAVVSVLELSSQDAGGDSARTESGSPAPSGADAPPLSSEDAEPHESKVELGEAQREIARRAWRSGGELLQGGALSAGALLQAELLRSVHAARVEGLHRLAASGLRLVRAIRRLRGQAPGAGARELPPALEAWLEIAWRLLQGADHVDLEWIGQGRRRYGDAGTLRLAGVLSEAVVSPTGAGVVTLLVSEPGAEPRWFSLANVRPGPPSRAEAAYAGPIGIADLATPHRELTRGGLRVTRATASEQGRLGSGQQVRAASGPGQTWLETLGDEFGLPWDAQLSRARASLTLPPSERRAGADLVFGTGVVLGREGRTLWLAVGEEAVQVLPPLGQAAPKEGAASLGERALGLLARAPGLALAWIGRLEESGDVRLLACGPPLDAEGALASSNEDAAGPPGPAWCLPDDWLGRVNVGLDPLEVHHLGRLEPRAFEVSPGAQAPSPLRGLGRRLERLALGGPATLVGGAEDALRRDAAALRAAYLPGAAALLLQLADAARGQERDLSGQLSAPEPEALARAFLGGQLYLGAAEEALAQHS